MTTRDDAVLDHAARATKRADRMERLYADRMANRRTVRHHP